MNFPRLKVDCKENSEVWRSFPFPQNNLVQEKDCSHAARGGCPSRTQGLLESFPKEPFHPLCFHFSMERYIFHRQI